MQTDILKLFIAHIRTLEDDGDGAQYLESKSDCLDERSLPIAFKNRLHDQVQNKCGDNIQVTTERIRNDNLKSRKHVVARGGNSKRDSSYINENTTTFDKDILVNKERVTKMLATRLVKRRRFVKKVHCIKIYHWEEFKMIM